MLLPRLALAAGWTFTCVAAGTAGPWIDRIEPFGGQRGTAVEVELVGRDLPASGSLEFDTPHLSWQAASPQGSETLRGRITVAAEAPLGPHIAHLSTPSGRSNSRLFYVHELRSAGETEPNDTPGEAQKIVLQAQTLHGAMHELSDIDIFRFEATAGERWTFDLRSLEYGGFLENDMTLLDASGRRVAFNDDRDEYLETPFLEHTFAQSGTHFLKLDQYRGPQRVNCHRNCGYMLRIGQLPVVEAAFPLGARPGTQVEVSIRGRALRDAASVWLVPVRRAEYYRLTFPFTVPVETSERPPGRLEGRITRREDRRLTARFAVPADAWRGLWRLWVRSPGGASDSVSLEISDMPATDCRLIRPSAEGTACDGVLEDAAREHEYWLDLRAGRPLVATTLAAQLGLPAIDTVLELFDDGGELVAEHDDLMTGQGTVIGNPDSMLAFTPVADGRFRLVVRDRIGRTGPDMAYRLRIEERAPRFALLSDPEAINVRAGTSGRIGILLTPEPGFSQGVDAWVEDPPPGIVATRARFRARQFFGPSGDGDNIVIPAAHLDVTVDSGLPAGDYPLRILGRSTDGTITVEAISTLWIGPPRKRNDVRRPLESIRLTVLSARAPEGEGAAATGGSR